MTPIFGGPGVLADLEAKSKRERYLLELEEGIRRAGLPPVEREVKFHPSRKWALDFAWPEWKVAIEYQGGIFAGAKKGEREEWKQSASHRSLNGILRDQWKGNEAQVLGWVVILANAQTVVTGQVLEWAERALVARGWKGARPRPAGAWAGADGEVLATEKGFRLVALKGRRGRKTLAVVLAGQKEKMPAGVLVTEEFVRSRVLG